MVAISATSVSQGTMVVGKSVKGVTVDPQKFSPQIDNSVRLKHVQKDHEMMFNYPLGQINNLTAGGTLTGSRITPGFSSMFPGMSATGYEPPDPDLAVGPNHIVHVVNSDIAFYTKSGTKLFQQSEQNFFKSVSPDAFDYDPKVIYDQIAKRFVVLDLGLNDASSGGTSNLIIGVSDTPDPTGTWKLFKVSVLQTSGSNTYWWDYPGLGYNKDMICMSGNMFAMTGSSGFNGVQIVAFDKTLLYSGTATPNKATVPDGFTIQLGKTEDPTSNSVFGVETYSQSAMRLTAITKVGSNFNVSLAVVNVPNWTRDSGLITGPGGVQVQTNDPRSLTVCSSSGRVLATHTVAVSSSDSRSSARWYDFKTNNWPASGLPTLFQSGQVDPPAGHGFSFPAISMDIKGGIGMVFSKIGTSTPGQLMGTGRKPTDPAGTMGNPVVLESSTASQYNGFSTRWGDYHDLELDPTDSKTFWAVGMGAGNNGQWQTYIKSFKISASDADLIPVTAAGVTTVAGTLVSGDRSSLSTTNDVNLVIQSAPVKGLGQAAGFNAVYNLPFSNTVDTLRMFITLTGPNGASALISIRNIKTGVYDQVSSVGLTNSAVSKTIDLTPEQIALYVSSSNQISIIIRGVNPARSGVNPAAFSFKTDQASLGALPKS